MEEAKDGRIDLHAVGVKLCHDKDARCSSRLGLCNIYSSRYF